LEQLRIKQQRQKKRRAIDRQSAFLEFKALPEGKTFEEQIVSNRGDLKDQKQRVKHFTDGCNLAKKELDTIKIKLDAKTEEKRLTMHGDAMDYEDDEGNMEGEGNMGNT